VTSSNIVLRDELILGRRELAARFRASPSYTAGAKERLKCIRSSNTIYHLVAGWACRVRDFPDGHHAIVDVYLPGDVIGLEGMLFPRSLADVVTLTSVARGDRYRRGISRPNKLSVYCAVCCLAARPTPETFGSFPRGDFKPRRARPTGDYGARFLQAAAASRINHRVNLQPAFDADPDWSLSRNDRGTRQPCARGFS